MESKLDADLTETCAKHGGGTLDFFCKRCSVSVCAVCAAIDHADHGIDIGCAKTRSEELTELRGNLEIRKRKVKVMKTKCREMLEQVNEISEAKLLAIEQDSDRRRSSVELNRKDFERRVKGITDSLDKEENKIYALEYSSEAALSAKMEGGGENFLDDIHEELGKCTKAHLPRVNTYKDLKVRFMRMQSANRFSSSSMVTMEELETTSFATASFYHDGGQRPLQFRRSRSRDAQVACSSRCTDAEPSTSQSELVEPEAATGSEREELLTTEENKEDESGDPDMEGDIEAEMGSDASSDCSGEGAEGGLVFGQVQRGRERHVGRDDDVVLSDLVMQLLPENATTLGVRLGLSNILIKHILHDHHRNISDALFQVLQEWKKTLSVEVLTEDHFKTLEQCLREIENESAADWLEERLQKSERQCQAMQPSSSPDQHGQTSISHMMQPSSSDSQ